MKTGNRLIVVSGLTAAGKTTHCQLLARSMRIPYFSASTVMREIARTELDFVGPWGDNWSPALDKARAASDIDSMVDHALLESLLGSSAGVFDACLLPWISTQSQALNLWLDSDENSRVKKCIVSHLADRKLSFDEARRIIREKDEFTASTLAESYGSQLTPDSRFQIVLSNSHLIESADRGSADSGIAQFQPVVEQAIRFSLGETDEEPRSRAVVRLGRLCR